MTPLRVTALFPLKAAPRNRPVARSEGPNHRFRGFACQRRGGWNHYRILRTGLLLIPVVLLTVAGCGTMRNGRGWGEDAKDASDTLRDILIAEAAATVLLTPSGDEPGEWLAAKAKGAAVELAAAGATGAASSWFKGATGRERPDASNDNSLPSAHASASFAAATPSNHTIDATNWPKPAKRTVQTANLLVATGVAWARVEGARHYPSDVLAGAVLGTFLSAFIHDAFLPTVDDERFQLLVFPNEDSGMLQVAFSI